MADINQTFKIYNADGTQFNGLELKKSTYTSVVMSLDDKIEGDIFYKDNSLSFTFKEYVVYNNVNYYLKLDNPPTIVRKGMTEDNGDLRGMTKYSLTFYHPMAWLSSIPFTDVAVSDDEKKYKSEDTTFAWVGTITDLVTKINKNLQGTNWTCALQTGFIDNGVQSDILSFDNQKISDVLKTCYETFKVPFTIDGYSIKFGTPSNEIKNEDGSNFVFELGQGLGLKNNDRTPKNNQIITRIAGYGSSENIPFGYPKIKWTGNSQWNYTINNDASAANSYPIIDGTIDGESVRLINHPFTRSVLMPTVYVDSVNKKVNPNASGYDPDTTLIDYYDAIDDATHTYINHINTASPSYDKHQFEKIKPSIVGAEYNNQRIDMIKSITPCDANGNDVTYWDDSTDDEGNYKQSYFKIELYPLGFDLYAMASVTSEMSVNMTSGACNGCKFNLGVDWDDVKSNFYVTDENGKIIFTPDGDQRDYTKYPDSTTTSIKIILQKDTSTFGVLMPSIYQQPTANDTFVLIGIEMPQIYITNTQKTLDESMKQYMLENNVAYYEYPFDFDEYFLKTRQYILNQIKPNSIIRFKYVNDTFALSVKELAITYGDKPLPTYKITLTDDVTIVLNQLGQLSNGLSQLGSQVAMLESYYDKNILKEINNKLSKVSNDTEYGVITFQKVQKFIQGIISDTFTSGALGSGFCFQKDANGDSYMEVDRALFRKSATFFEIIIQALKYAGGQIILTPASMHCIKVDEQTDTYRCYFRATDSGKSIVNEFMENDMARCQTFNLSNNTNQYYWRKVVGVGADYIDLSKTDCDNGSTIPQVGDNIVQLGNTTNTQRQGAIMLSSHGNDTPSITLYSGIGSDNTNKYSLANKDYVSFGVNSTNGEAYLKVYGNSYIGNREKTQYIEYKDGIVSISGTLSVGTKLSDGTNLDDSVKSAMSKADTIKTYINGIDKDKENATKSYQTLKSSDLFDDDTYTFTFYTSDDKMFLTSDNKSIVFYQSQVIEAKYNDYIAEANKMLALIQDITDDDITDEDIERINTEFVTYNSAFSDFNSEIQNCYNIIQTNTEGQLGGLNYLSEALNNDTAISGGLILTSAIILGSKNTDETWTVRSGISGIYEEDKVGGGLATFWGGANIDKEYGTGDLTNAALSAVRFDGSGYLAKGNISWDEDGNASFKNKSNETDDERSLTIQGNEIGLTNENGQLSLQLDGNTVASLSDLIGSIESHINFNFASPTGNVSADALDNPNDSSYNTVVLIDYDDCGITDNKNYSVIVPSLQVVSSLSSIAANPSYSESTIDYSIEFQRQGETSGVVIGGKNYISNSQTYPSLQYTDTLNSTTIYTNKPYRIIFKYYMTAMADGDVTIADEVTSSANVSVAKVSSSSVIEITEISKLTRIYGNGLIVKQATNKYLNIGTFVDNSKLINAKDTDSTNSVYSLDMVKTYCGTTTWYRKWNNGWLECGGLLSATTNDRQTQNYPIAFISTPFVVTAPYGTEYNKTYEHGAIHTNTSTYFTWERSDNFNLYWYACGLWKNLDS